MAKIIDISAKLTNERPQLKLAEDKIYEIDDRKNAILKLNQMMKKSDLEDVESVDEMIGILLGKKAVKEINEMNLPITAYQSVVIACVAAISGVDYEVAEARFRREAEL